ncbi:ABC transporter substrate-binding protein [Rhodococcus sp. NPDC003382]
MKRRDFLFGSVLAGAALVSTACGQGTSVGGAGTDLTVDPDGTLRFAWAVGPANLDPHMATSEAVWFRYGLPSVYDRLFTVDARGQVHGRLVREHSYSSDGSTLFLTLRDDVTFRDGRALDAEVVKLNLDRARTLDSPVTEREMSQVSDVAVLGSYRLALVPHHATFALSTISRSFSSTACLFRQMM